MSAIAALMADTREWLGRTYRPALVGDHSPARPRVSPGPGFWLHFPGLLLLQWRAYLVDTTLALSQTVSYDPAGASWSGDALRVDLCHPRSVEYLRAALARSIARQLAELHSDWAAKGHRNLGTLTGHLILADQVVARGRRIFRSEGHGKRTGQFGPAGRHSP